MAPDWREVRLGDVAEFTSGGTPKSSVADYWDGDIPWISAASMKSIFLSDSDRTLTPQGLESGSRLATEGSVLLLVRGSELHKRIPIGVATRPVAFNQDVKALRARDGLRQDFLLYWLLGNERTLLGKVENTGIGAGKLDTKVLKNLRVLLPDLPEQRAIAHILGTLDDKIELNRRMNQTLEGMVRALFKSWFVDFDPVRAKMEGRWQPGETLPGLPAELYDLFPDRLVASELGEVPEGWEVRPLDDVVSLRRDSVKPQDYPHETFHHYSIPAFDEGCTPKAEPGEAIKSSKYRVPARGVLISKLNPRIPRVWLPAVSDDHRSICSTEFLVVEPGEPAMRPWVYSLLCSDRFQSRFCALVTGTSGSHQRVRPDAFLALGVVLPPLSVRVQFGSFAGELLARIGQARKDSETLAKVRDALLPELISGALRIGDAARIETMASA